MPTAISTFSVPQAAEECSVSAATLWRAHARGELPHHRIGRRVVLTEDDLRAFLAARAVPARKAR